VFFFLCKAGESGSCARALISLLREEAPALVAHIDAPPVVADDAKFTFYLEILTHKKGDVVHWFQQLGFGAAALTAEWNALLLNLQVRGCR
jgi:hypothetical protein